MSDSESEGDLHVPSTFKDKSIAEKDVREWNARAQAFLKLYGKQHVRDVAGVAAVAQLSSSEGEPWLEAETTRLAQNILADAEVSCDLIGALLEGHVKPVLRSNPHPRLSLTTGRALSRPAGGTLASQDYLQEQEWKDHPGLANMVGWCIRAVSAEDVEKIWFLLVPPVMTFLDDYQAKYKLRGVKLAGSLLEKVPPTLLTRTGIDSLLFESLNKNLLFLHDPLTPSLILTTVPTILTLTTLTTAPSSPARFARLFALLGEHILGGVWVYAAQDRAAVLASLTVLPALAAQLGIGCARFLGALVPQCCHCLSPSPSPVPDLSESATVSASTSARDKALQLAALEALEAVMEACRPRLFRWKGAIVEGVGRLWVALCDDETVDMQDEEDTRKRVVNVFRILSEACPSVVENEYARLLQKEPEILKDVLVH